MFLLICLIQGMKIMTRRLHGLAEIKLDHRIDVLKPKGVFDCTKKCELKDCYVCVKDVLYFQNNIIGLW